MMFETATLVRLAPWLTSVIFLWSLLSGLLGDVHLPSLHRHEHPMALGASSQDAGYLGLWEQAAGAQDSRSRPDAVYNPQRHEGRLLQLMPNFTDSVVNASAQSKDTQAFSARNNSSSRGSSSSSDDPNRSILLPNAGQAGRQPSPASATSSMQTHFTDQDSNTLNSKLVGSSDGDNVMSFVSSQPHHPSLHQAQDVDVLSRNSTALFSNDTAGAMTAHVSDPAGSQANRTLSSTDSAQLSTDSNFEACPPHLDLPTPGMDIAPANESKCYTHPAKYINTNYLNDSFYMLYHHDKLPTSEPHPAFTWGDISRFSHAMHKMKRNDPVKAIFVGGSVSSSYCRNPLVRCWVSPVAEWLQQQNPNVKIINNAVGGTTSRTTAECFDAMVSKDADLVFLEYSYNDRFAPDPGLQQQGYELLVRKLLKLPHKPAVVIVHWWGPRHDCTNLLTEAEAVARSEQHADHRCAMTLWNSTEDRIQTIVQHYGVQSISFRNAFWAEIDAEVDGLRPDQTLMPDFIHPNKRGVELLGNLVIRFVTEAQERLSRWGRTSHPSSSHLPLPLYVDAAMDEQSNTCTRGDALQDMMVHTVDWYWVDGKKPGFQTDTPTASLVLMVTLPDSEISKLSLGYLASYEGMGWAQVECLGACSCHRMKIDANSTARASQEHFATIDVERQNEGSGCLLKVSNLNQSSSFGNGHKFKVSSVAWSGENQSSGTVLQSAQQDVAAAIDTGDTQALGSEHAVMQAELGVMIGSI